MAFSLEEPFSLEEIDRYERQILLPEWGAAGQERVRAASVAVMGTGVAVEMAARYLVGAGVGRVIVGDEAIADVLRGLNPYVEVNIASVESSSRREGPGEGEHSDGEPLLSPSPCPLPPGKDSWNGLVVGGVRLEVADDTHAVGAALAVEGLKAILGLPFHRVVTLDPEGP